MSHQSECIICIEKYNKSSHYPIICKFCDYKACSSCCQSYLLTINIPQCMNCHNEWQREFLNENFKKTFINKTLKDHHKKYLFDIETSLIPQAILEAKRRKTIDTMEREILEMKRTIRSLYKQIREKYNDLHLFRNNRNVNANANDNSQNNQEKINFIRRCPADNCKGFLSTRWKCELCSVYVCKDCHRIKAENQEENPHVCNNDDVETAKMITNNTKACPSCTVPIYKIDGCLQMWCTNCHTAFNWNTGRIETRVHNPHYFEWLRKNNNGAIDRNPLDIQCGRNLDIRFISQFETLVRFVKRKSNIAFNEKNDEKIQEFVINIEIINNYRIRSVNHILEIDIPRFNDFNRETYNLDLRIKYINNEIDEERFKTQICSSEKKMEKNRELVNILTMYCHSSIDIIYRLYTNMFEFENSVKNKESTIKKIDISIFDEYNNLILYANENLQRICNIYGIKNNLLINQYGTFNSYNKNTEKLTLFNTRRMNGLDDLDEL